MRTINVILTMARARVSRRCVAFAVLVLSLPWPCLAEVLVDASATARYEYNTNVYDLQSGFPVPGTSDPDRADSLYAYGAALDAKYLWAQQKLFANLSATDFHYDRFTDLNHNEYNLDAGWNWKLGRTLDGTLEILRSHAMESFVYTVNGDFVLQTEQRESAKIGFQFLPDWRIEGSGYYHTVDQNSSTAPALDLTESYGEAALKFTGLAGVTSGFSVGYADGNYDATSEAPSLSYRQINYSFVGTYEPTGRSKLDGALGYSDRTSSSEQNTVSGFTGKIDYESQLTGKTWIELQVNRVINSYVAQTGSEIDTDAGFNVRWQATYKVRVEAGYLWTRREIPGQGNAPVGSTRLDNLQYATLKVAYEPLRWLSIRPYISYQTRSSNYDGANFNASVYGVYFDLKWQNEPPKDAVIHFQGQP